MANYKMVHCADCCKEIKSWESTMIKRGNHKAEYYCDSCMEALQKIMGKGGRATWQGKENTTALSR